MEKLSFTLLELGNSESPNIGTITGSTEEELVQKAIKAIESHFDALVTNFRMQDNLTFNHIKNSRPAYIYATFDADPYGGGEVATAVVEVQQTWLY